MQGRFMQGRRLRLGILLGWLLLIAIPAAPVCAQKTPSAALPSPEKTLPAIGAPAASSIQVTFQDGKLEVKAENANLADLLRKVAETARLAMEISQDVSGSVSISFAGLSVEDGIKRVLEASGRTNYAAEFKGVGDAAEKSLAIKRIVIASGKQGQVPVQTGAQSPQNFDALYDYVKGKYGKYEALVDEGTRKLRLIEFHEPGISQKINRDNMERYCRSKFDELLPFLGVSVDMLRFEEIRENSTDTTCVFPQVVNSSVPVEGAAMSITVWKPAPGTKTNDFVQFGNGAYLGINVPAEPKLAAEEALKIAQDRYRRDYRGKLGHREDEADQVKPSCLVIFPKGDRDDKPTRFDFFLTWRVELLGARFYVDASSGEVVSRASHIKYLSGTLSGRRYGADNGTSYKEDFENTSYAEGLGRLYIWRSSDANHNIKPASPIVMTSSDATNRGYFEGISNADLPIYTRLDSEWFRIYIKGENTPIPNGVIGEWTSKNDGTDLTSAPFGDSDTEGHRTNIYHQLFRGRNWLVAGGLSHNYPPEGLKVFSSVEDLGPHVLGSAAGNMRILLTSEGAKSSDTILHELTHTAVYTNRGGDIGTGESQQAISEGLAEFFAARMNNDPILEPAAEKMQRYLDGRGDKLEKVTDWNGDGVIDDKDFSHYNNGKAVASALWDLGLSRMADSRIWNAIQSPADVRAMPLYAYSPEAIYTALRNFQADPNQLWDSFSTHGVNLWAREDSRGGVFVNWFPHYGSAVSAYLIWRATDSAMSDRALVATVPKIEPTTENSDPSSYQDVTADKGHKFFYQVSPANAPNNYSNIAWGIAEQLGGDPPPPPSNVTFSVSPQVFGGVARCRVLGNWTPVDPLLVPDFAHYVIDRRDLTYGNHTLITRQTAQLLDYGEDLGQGRRGFIEGDTYTYQIASRDMGGLSSNYVPQPPVSLIPNPPAVPSPPPSFQAAVDTSGVKLTWAAPTSNTDQTTLCDLAGYRLYRRQEKADGGISIAVGARGF